MNEIFFTSDTHFSHNQDFVYKPRGFTDVKEMNEAILENWNQTVPYDATVYHLGDIVLNDIDEAIKYIKRLSGNIIWLRGNHCTDNKVIKILDECPNVTMPYEMYALVKKLNGCTFYLSHYPTLTANFDDKHFSRHVFNLHGHTHQRSNWLQPDNPFMYHVGVDSHNCTPVHIDEVITDIRQRWNDLGLLPTPSKPKDLYPYGGFINGN